MERIYRIATLLTLLLAPLAAQDPNPAEDLKDSHLRQLKVMGTVMGPAVKGAPYSAVEVSESSQVLGDGTRIHHEIRTTVNRDSEGRVRRETPNEITIFDPVAGASYAISPKAQTWRKMPLGMGARGGFARVAGAQTFEFRTFGPEPPEAVDLQRQFAQQAAKLAEAAAVAARMPEGAKFNVRRAGKSESLGQQTIEGVTAEGTRFTTTIEAGAIGNDRPIQSVSEEWYSPELKTLIKSVRTDPRTGEETFQLMNISRVDQPPYLFQVPAGYQERK